MGKKWAIVRGLALGVLLVALIWRVLVGEYNSTGEIVLISGMFSLALFLLIDIISGEPSLKTIKKQLDRIEKKLSR